MKRFCTHQLPAPENPEICNKLVIGCPYNPKDTYLNNGNLAIAQRNESGEITESCKYFSPTWLYKLKHTLGYRK